MDSMRHLSTSLPPQRTNPPNDLLAEFKNAAMSVTNLYRSAVSSQKQARSAGYQDALDDLLAFLDKENLGLMDGEGWRVRQWATERLAGYANAGRQANTGMTDEEDDGTSSTAKDDEKDDERSSSPEIQRKSNMPRSSSELAEEPVQHRRVVSEPPQPPTQPEFTFQSTHPYPASNHDRDANADIDMDISAASPAIQTFSTSSVPSSTETVRIVQRHSRANRQSHSRRNNTTNSPTLNFNLGSGAGSKRKIPYPDFFDISGINDGGDRKDGGAGRGGKRRHV